MKNYLRNNAYVLLTIVFAAFSCGLPGTPEKEDDPASGPVDSVFNADPDTLMGDTLITDLSADSLPRELLKPWATYPAAEIVSFAKTLLGSPYRYASSDPVAGFDCSGFITYVYNHFGMQVPRSSVDFTNKGKPVPVREAAAGDLILFTETDSASTTVGHMGIVVENTDSLRFIHSSSGKANGVTITPLNAHYQRRFVKVISIKEGL